MYAKYILHGNVTLMHGPRCSSSPSVRHTYTCGRRDGWYEAVL